jgi:hypothetical protein
MNLDSQTFEKVLGLFPNMPYSHVIYCGCWSKDTVSFTVGVQDNKGNMTAGIYVTVTHDFKIVKVERLHTIWGRNTRKYPTVKVKIPIHPMGEIPSIYL